jgi:spore coat protein U-like protein
MNIQAHNQSHRKVVMIAGLVMMAGLSMQATAGTVTTSFSSTASVNALCQTLSASTMAFGNYDPTSGSDTTATTTVSVACTTGTVPSITFSAGTTSGATTAQRLLANGASTMQYNIYTSNTYTQVMDGSTNGKLTVTGTGLGTTVNATAYGKIPKNQLNVVTGNYSDSITVTVTY